VLAVIGKYLDKPSYIQVGERLNVKVLDFPRHLWQQMSPSERWTATQNFLDGIIAREGDFLFNKAIKSIGSQSGEFRKELDYISQQSYQLRQDGWGMTKVVEDASPASKHVPFPTDP
jgi:hypothetical protein